LLQDKIAIVITSFEAEKARITAEYAIKTQENRTKLAEHEYALASLQTSYDESQRTKLNCEDKKNELQEDLMVTLRENEILKASNEDLHEIVTDLNEEARILRRTLQSAYSTMEIAHNSRANFRGYIEQELKGRITAHSRRNMSTEAEVSLDILGKYHQHHKKTARKKKNISLKMKELAREDSKKIDNLNEDVGAREHSCDESKNVWKNSIKKKSFNEVGKPDLKGLRTEIDDARTLDKEATQKLEVNRKKRRRLLNQCTIDDI